MNFSTLLSLPFVASPLQTMEAQSQGRIHAAPAVGCLPKGTIKGQALPIDLLLSLLIMTVLAVYALSSYDDYRSRHDSLAQRRTLETSAHYLSEALIRTQGSPPNWTRCVAQGGQNIPCLKSIGLANGWNSLDHPKVEALKGVNSYSKLKDYLGLDYDFYLELDKANGSVIFAKGKGYSDRNSVTVTRIAEYNGSAAIMRLTLYENQ